MRVDEFLELFLISRLTQKFFSPLIDSKTFGKRFSGKIKFAGSRELDFRVNTSNVQHEIDFGAYRAEL